MFTLFRRSRPPRRPTGQIEHMGDHMRRDIGLDQGGKPRWEAPPHWRR